jgi:hypothetical protein
VVMMARRNAFQTDVMVVTTCGWVSTRSFKRSARSWVSGSCSRSSASERSRSSSA